MNSQQLQDEPQQRFPVVLPRKKLIDPPLNPQDDQIPASMPSPALESGPLVNAEPKRKRGRPRTALSVPKSTAEQFLAERAEAPSISRGDDSKERPIRIIRHVPPCCRGSFSGLRSIDRRNYASLQIERIQGDPEEVVYLTESDEDVDDSTDVEDGGFEGAERRRRFDALVEALREIEAGEELDSMRARENRAT
ncbi:Nn.00g030620.m01.CDS01 [Neocucurbitaria sp. VM-36]